MIKKVLPFAGALVAVLAFIAVGTGGVRLQVPNTNVITTTTTSADAHQHDGAATPAAPEPIVPPAGGSKIAIASVPAEKPELGYALTAQVTSPQGKPVGDATIRFSDVIDLFGQREELIGTAQTDGQGMALIYYLPATAGTHTIVARFGGQGTLTPSLGVTDVELAQAAKPYKADAQPLAAFSRYVPYAAVAIALTVWALIAFSLLGTARGIVAARANEMKRKGETA